MKQNKKTLYDLLIESYELMGKVVEEGSWVENIEHKKPTKEYWFDVIVSEEGDTRHQLHFFFGSDKNNLLYTEYWTSRKVIDYIDFSKVF